MFELVTSHTCSCLKGEIFVTRLLSKKDIKILLIQRLVMVKQKEKIEIGKLLQ